MAALSRILVWVAVWLLVSCSHAPPEAVQIFDQVDRVFDPVSRSWSGKLSVFVQASSADGNKVFDRLHLVHDGQGLYFSLAKDRWSAIERPGEFWIGARDLAFPDGRVPTGEWRALLVTRSGQKAEMRFIVPPQPSDAAGARTLPVSIQPDAGGYRVSGWVDNYLVWSRDAKGNLVSRAKVTGGVFQVPSGAATFTLYSYDKDRGEGLEAGPFPVQEKG